jgi:hypothetical protein
MYRIKKLIQISRKALVCEQVTHFQSVLQSVVVFTWGRLGSEKYNKKKLC